MLSNQRGEIKPSNMFVIAIIAIVGLIGIITVAQTVSWNETGETTIVQYPNGQLMVKTSPGPYAQIFGRREVYRQVVTVGFGDIKGKKSANIPAVPVIFNTGSKAKISGIIRVKLPLDESGMTDIFKNYAGGFDHFVRNGIVPVVNNAVKLAANLRSEQDAYTAIASFQEDVSDQLTNGIYMTESKEVVKIRETGEEERVRITVVKKDKNGNPIRKDNVLQNLGCSVTQCQIEIPQFDPAVEKAIALRKQQSLETEIAKQKALRAEQDALTAVADAKARVAQERATQEVEKVKAVVAAEKTRDVARLDKEAAAYEKQAMILKGQGEAQAKKLAMQADGALKQKLDALRDINGLWAKAFAQYKGNIVPSTVMGGSGSGSSSQNGFQQWMQVMTAKAARDLNVDMSVKK